MANSTQFIMDLVEGTLLDHKGKFTAPNMLFVLQSLMIGLLGQLEYIHGIA